MRVRLTFAAAAAAFAVALLGGCAPAGPGIDEIDAVDFRQSQAIPDFDSSDYTQDDPAEIERFIDLLEQYGIDPANWRGQDTGGCTGNRVTGATVRYAGSDLATQFSVDSCSDDAFEQAADDLFTQWRVDLSGR